MTHLVINDVERMVQISGTGGQIDFGFSFEFLADEDLLVYLTPKNQLADDTADLLTLNTHYTVTGAGTNDPKKITLVTPTILGDIVTIWGALPVERLTNFSAGSNLPAEDFNDEFQRLVIMVAEQETLLSKRVFHAMNSDVMGDDDLVLPAKDIGKLLGWGNSGLVNLENTLTGVAATAFGTILATTTDAADARDELDVRVETSALQVNPLNNSNFHYWQHGTAIAATSHAADRWYIIACTAVRSTDVPPDNLSKFSIKITDDGTANDPIMYQRLEGAECRRFEGQNVVVSAWVKGTGIEPIIAALFTPTSSVEDDWTGGISQVGGSPNIPAMTAGWTKMVWVFPLALSNCRDGLHVRFKLENTASQTEDVYITRIQLEAGVIATDYRYKGLREELSDCQRSYCKTYNLDIDVGSFIVYEGSLVVVSASTTAGVVQANWQFPVRMRGLPFIRLWNPRTGTSNQWDRTLGASVVGAEADYDSESGAQLISSSVTVAFASHRVHADANAELNGT